MVMMHDFNITQKLRDLYGSTSALDLELPGTGIPFRFKKIKISTQGPPKERQQFRNQMVPDRSLLRFPPG